MSNIVNDTIVSIVITSKDVHGLAEANDVDFDEALQRVRDWARHLEDGAEGLLMEQLNSVIVRGQPGTTRRPTSSSSTSPSSAPPPRRPEEQPRRALAARRQTVGVLGVYDPLDGPGDVMVGPARWEWSAPLAAA